jgi:hypothetical protein
MRADTLLMQVVEQATIRGRFVIETDSRAQAWRLKSRFFRLRTKLRKAQEDDVQGPWPKAPWAEGIMVTIRKDGGAIEFSLEQDSTRLAEALQPERVQDTLQPVDQEAVLNAFLRMARESVQEEKK